MRRFIGIFFPLFIVVFTAFLMFAIRQESNSYLAPKANENQSEKWQRVIRVIDGDTIDVDINRKMERVRLIGVDTPEIKDLRKKIECFGYEASLKTKELLNDKLVRLESDETQSDKDKYGRLLRYAYSDNQIFVNEELIRKGYAYEYTYNVPYKYKTRFKEAEKRVRADKIGLWSSRECDEKIR